MPKRKKLKIATDRFLMFIKSNKVVPITEEIC